MKTTPNKLNSNINPEIQRLTEYLIETATTYCFIGVKTM